MDLSLIQRAGCVGMGGAGFPAHVKLQARVDTLLINAAECEPLLRKDNMVMQHFAEGVAQGTRLAAEATGAGRVIVGIKGKNKASIEAMRATSLGPAGSGLYELGILGDFYPAGDEVTLVYELTGRVVPPAGLPLDVGVVVLNNETALTLHEAAQGRPVTHSFLTVSGEVRRPMTVRAPVGTPFRDLIEAAGGTRLKDWVILDGGPMMGRIVEDPSTPVVKTTSGVIVLPRDHPYVGQELRSREAKYRIGKSVCDQCSLCTQLCPRYLLGHPLEPHQAMRQQFVVDFPAHSRWGQICCECGICTLFACPEGLFPREACQDSKRSLAALGERFNGPKTVTPHPMYEHRRLPTKKLLARLGLTRFEHDAPWTDWPGSASPLRLLMRQHIGVPAETLVREGDTVAAGQLVAAPPEGKLGAPVHTPRAGRVASVTQAEIVVQ
ncbi:MAG: SLBB domain-containing protein [bacterium]|jgi:Na+-translocating ferredoxin:NAD+ oxidoreductase RnfC subunit|nr:SLBB domain-containing protein [bacterium]